MSLKQCQSDFQAYILNGEYTIAKRMIAPKNMPVLDRLNIYQNGYFQRIIQSMSQDFPVICALIGEDAFSSMVCDYLAVYPSHYASLRYVGKQLSDFLKVQDEALAGFVDLAILEYSLCEITAEPILLQTRFNILDVWQAYQDDEALGEIAPLEIPVRYIIRNGELYV